MNDPSAGAAHAAAGPAAAQATLDPENPWLGLDSYTEETRAYFHGRDEETAELARRVQRANLAILFGQSGLGKTSLLRAGLVPRLRAEGYCPVYVRLDYAPTSPSASEQIKRAVFRATRAAGYWTRPGAAVAGESLWEFLHHRDDLLRDADGRTLTPLLIFDQFEEIFTLGQADDAGRARAREFLEDLADLVENRPPAALEARMDEDENLAENYDFGRAGYRVLITLREDYLANLEGLKDVMPSITQNRMRLARMDGAQALSAVVKPGGNLVSQEVAEAIVRFVAGGAELANAEIEPSLLSLVCRELNNARKAQDRKEISADLLAGSRDTILAEFYQRALADQPDGVRRVIEDDLLTESGYRESLAEERVLKALADAGAAPATLPTLVNRRLLRIEERLDMRRVELTHDVLCGVVLASRNQRHEREARAAAERKLAEQREREAAMHRALVRTRLVAAVCSVLLIFALAAAAFGFWSLHRARTAEAQAQHSRANAEQLVSFLIEDFYDDLAPTGRLETLGRLAKMTAAYYERLPANLVTPQTRINQGMALAREGAAQMASGDAKMADKTLAQAGAIFKELHDAGDHGEPVTYGLALVSFNQGMGRYNGIGSGSYEDFVRANDLLRPLVYGAEPSRRVRQLYGDSLMYHGASLDAEGSMASAEESRKVLAGLGALDLSDLTAAASYADAGDGLARSLAGLNRPDEAEKIEQETYDLAEKILAKRPGDLHALSLRVLAADLLSMLAGRRYDYRASADYARRAVSAAEDAVRFNPSDLLSWNAWLQELQVLAAAQYNLGDARQAIATLQSATTLERDPRRPSAQSLATAGRWRNIATVQSALGDATAAEASLAMMRRAVEESLAHLPADSPWRTLNPESVAAETNMLLLDQGHAQAAWTATNASLARLEKARTQPGTYENESRNGMLRIALAIATRAALRLGHTADAETMARRWLAVPPQQQEVQDPIALQAGASTALAHALALQGKLDEARRTVAPGLDWFQQQAQVGASDPRFRHDYAYALYVHALAAPADAAGRKQRQADLDAATRVIDEAPGESRQLADLRHVSGLIAAARSRTGS